MNLRELHWPLLIGLGALGLVRPLVNTVADQNGADLPAVVPIALTLAVSAVWIAVVGLHRVAHPVLSLIGAGLSYAVLSILLAGVLSSILTGTLQGPLANPVAVVPVLVVSAVWGGVCGLVALVLQRARGRRRPA